VANKKTGLSGACFGLVRVWAHRILCFPNESAQLRMQWLKAHENDAVTHQRAYQAVKKAVVQEVNQQLGMRDQGDADRLGVKRALAPAEILVDLDGQNRIDFPNLRYPPEHGPQGYTAPRRWFFDNEEVKANTAYFWDAGMTEQKTFESELHACASRHLTSLMDENAHFEFYDPNLGELRVPCSLWSEFIEGWVLRYTEGKLVVFIDRLSLLPMRRGEPKAEDVIQVVHAEWNAGWFRSKSAASTAAMARLQLLAKGAPATLPDLRQSIRWFAGRDADPTGTLATKYGAQPAAGSKLRTLLNTRFATHTFFR
jgi:hypothetical protein